MSKVVALPAKTKTTRSAPGAPAPSFLSGEAAGAGECARAGKPADAGVAAGAARPAEAVSITEAAAIAGSGIRADANRPSDVNEPTDAPDAPDAQDAQDSRALGRGFAHACANTPENSFGKARTAEARDEQETAGNGFSGRAWGFLHAHPHWIALALMLAFTLIRLWIACSGQIDLAQDEAQYWDWSRRLQLSYYSKGPLIAWIISVGTALFGNTELGVRLGAVLGNLCTQGLLYGWLAVLLQRPRLGLITLCLANTAPLFIVSGVLMTTDNPLLLCWVGALFCLTAVTERPRAAWPFWGLGAAMCLGILAKYTMLACGGIALLYVWRLRRRHMLLPGQVRKVLAAVCLGTALGLLPILLWNALNDFISLRHVAGLAGLTSQGEGASTLHWKYFPDYFGSQAGLLLPWWLGFMLWQGWKLLTACANFGAKAQHSAPGPAVREEQGGLRPKAKPRRSPSTASPTARAGEHRAGNWVLHAEGTRRPALAGGLPREDAAGYRFHLLLCLGFWPLWLFFLLWSFHTRIYPNWPAMSYAAGMVIAAIGVEAVWRSPATKTLGAKSLRVFTAASLVVCLIIHGQHYVTSLIPLPEVINPTVRLKGWSELGKQLGAVRRSMPNPDMVFFFSDAYDVTAALAFYLPGQPVTYCVDFGRRANQYDLWPDPNGRYPVRSMLDAHSSGWRDRTEQQDMQQGIALRREDAFAADRPGMPVDAVFVTRKPMARLPGQLRDMFRDASGPPVAFQSEHLGQKGRAFGYAPMYGFTGIWPKTRWDKY